MEITLDDVAFESSVNVDDLAVGMSIFGTVFSIIAIIALIISVISVISMWKLFSKADESGWKAIVPILNIYTMFKIVWDTNAGLMTILSFIPGVNFIIYLIMLFKMAKAFDKGIGFFLLLLFLYPIGLPILAFGNSDYIGPQ